MSKASIADLDDLFDGAVRQNGKRYGLNVSMAPSDMSPGTLYHYTGAAGAEGILTQGYLRATNFSFLNDPTEVQYGRKLVIDMLDEQKGSSGKTDLFKRIKKDFKKQAVSEVYVCCFTKCRNDLSQWRAYGTVGAPRYCIGFDMNRAEADFHKVIYEEQEQREIIEKVTDFASKQSADPKIVAKWAAGRLARLLPQLKTPEYAREEEWRVIRRVPHGDLFGDVCFDSTRGVIRPYVKVKLAEKLPVVELLVLAPGREDASVKAADMLLLKAGIKGVKSKRSKVPFAELPPG